MDDKKTKYRKEYYLKNKEKLIEYGKKYYNERIYPKVEISIVKGNFILYFNQVCMLLLNQVLVQERR